VFYFLKGSQILNGESKNKAWNKIKREYEILKGLNH
jgi:hypothetical protein